MDSFDYETATVLTYIAGALAAGVYPKAWQPPGTVSRGLLRI